MNRIKAKSLRDISNFIYIKELKIGNLLLIILEDFFFSLKAFLFFSFFLKYVIMLE